jgi:hypothetical protein
MEMIELGPHKELSRARSMVKVIMTTMQVLNFGEKGNKWS